MFCKKLLNSSSEKKEQLPAGIHFKMHTDESEFELIPTNIDDYNVYINGKLSPQKVNNLTLKENDVVKVVKKTAGAFDKFTFNGSNISEILEPFPLTNTTSFERCFYACIYLKTVPADLFRYNTQVTVFRECFSSCRNITIPTGLFRYNTQVTDFNSCFFNCRYLTTIPPELFRYNTQATNVNRCFMSCSGLKTIPADLFKYNTQITDLSNCFSYCEGLTTIPVDLFKYNTQASSFSSCFMYCEGLTTIPVDLFKYNTKAEWFSYCFEECSNLTVFVRISGPNARVVHGFAEGTKAKGTVYVPKGSKTAEMFKQDPSVNVIVVEE